MDIVLLIKHGLSSVGASPVMWLMLALSVVSVAVMLERALLFVRVRVNTGALGRALADRLEARDLAGARALLAASRSVEAAVVGAGLAEFARGAAAVREAMAGATLRQRLRLERGLGFLGTLASNTPFIGLFGTVIGIVMAFDELGASGGPQGSASAAVMAAIAEALTATAVGIGVAVPAVAAFNAFQQRIRVILDQAAALGHVVLVHLEDPRGPERGNGRDYGLLQSATSALARHTSGREPA
jgi:biopolymer transport protein ExbB